MTVSIKVGAELDAAQINQQLADLTRRINGVGNAIAQAGRVRFEPIPRASLEMAQRIEQTMRNMQRIAPEMHKRLAATGQGGAAFDQIDWSRIYGDAAQRHRAQRRMFEMATGLGFGNLPVLPPGGPGMVPAGPGGRPVPGRAPGFGPFGPVIDAVGAGAGMPGQIGLTALHAGRASFAAAGGGMRGFGAGVAGGIGAGLGFAAIQGIGALMSGVREHVGNAQQEGIGYADLYRRMGGRGSGNHFSALRQSMRGVSDNIAVTYEEVLGLSQMAARRGNITSNADLAGMVGLGGGFGRSFGFDPGAGVAAFAGLRGVGATRSVDETRRLGLSIAEGIARAGVFAKAEEYLSEIATFGEQSARAGLVRPNMEGFNELLAGLVGMRLPGLDVRGAANLLTSADNAIRRGGAAGEAGQAFLYQAIGRRLGLDPMQTEVLQEGGAFATGRGTFGSGLVADYYRRMGIAVPEGAANDDTTLLEMVTEGLRGQYTGGNRRLLSGAAANLLGVNQRQAMALLSLDRQQITGMRGLLSEDQLRELSPTGIQTLGRIATGGRDELAGIAAGLMNRDGSDRLSAEERDRLRNALAGDDTEALRKALADLAASRQAEETEGDKTRRTLQGIDKTLTDLADKLVPAMNTARDALLAISGRNGGPGTARAVANAARDAEVAEADATRNAALADLTQRERTAGDNYARAQGLAANNPGDADLARRAEEARAVVEGLAGERQRIQAEHARAVEVANRRRDITLGGGSGRSAPVSGTVQERALAFVDLLRAHGGETMTENMALGFAANAIGESAAGGNQVGDGGRSSGYLQWNGQRRENFRRMFGKDPHEATSDEQARFVIWELTSRDPANTERGILAQMRAWVAQQPGGETPENWTRAITRFYERPAEPDRDAAIRSGHATALAAARRGRSGAPTTPAAPAPHPAAATDAVPPATPLAAANAEDNRIRAEAAALGVPMPADAPPGAVQAAGGAPQAARVEGTAAVDVTVRNEAGAPIAPPVRAQTTLRPARPFGAIRQGLRAYQ